MEGATAGEASSSSEFAELMLEPLAKPIEAIVRKLQEQKQKQLTLMALIAKEKLTDESSMNLEYVESVVNQIPIYERKIRHIQEVMNRVIFELQNLKMKASMLRERALASKDPASQERLKSILKGKDSLREKGSAMFSKLQEGLKG